jgi:3-hydroxypropanoate dehydrogenase
MKESMTMDTTVELAERTDRRALDAVGRALLFTDARTSNTFSDAPVSDEEMRSVWALAKWPPTAANTQPLRVVFVRSAEGRARLLPHMSEGNRAKTATAPVVAVLAVDTEFHEHIPEIFPIRAELREVFADNSTMREETSRFNATLQIGYFLLAIRALGLVAGPMAGFDKAGIDAEFFPDGRFRSLLVVNIGHPGADPWFERLPRLEDAKAISFA